MKVLFVINPRSGNRNPDELDKLIAAQAVKTGFEYSKYHMQSGNEEKNIREKIKEYAPQTVACAGGDGTVNLMARILAHTDINLLIIPYGSANGMAKELQIDSRVPEAIALLTNGIPKKIDLLKVNGHICIHLADVGLNARIVKRFEQDPKRGIITYAKYLLNELFLIKQYRFFISCGEDEASYKAVSLTFANASKYGTGAIINPDGILDDGIFELVIVKPFSRVHLFAIALKMFAGKLNNSEYVEVLKCRNAQVRTAKNTTLQVDGEVIGKVNKISIEMLHKALCVLVPAPVK